MTFLAIAPATHAATRFWNGGGANNLWTTAANWGGSAVAAGDDLIFQGGAGVDATSLNNTNDFAASTAFRSITFTGTNYGIYGNAIRFTNTSVVALSAQNGAGTNRLNLNLTFQAAQTFECTLAGGTLIVGGDIALGGNNLTNNVVGRIRLAGVISQNGVLFKNGAGTLNIEGSNPNTFSGSAWVNAGTLELGKSSSICSLIVGDGSGVDTVRYLANNPIGGCPVVVSNGAILDLNGFSQTLASGLSALTISGGTVTLGGGALKVGGPITSLSAPTLATISGGTLDLAGAIRTFDIGNGVPSPDMTISAVITNGGVTKAGTGNLRFSGANTFTNAITINAGFLFAQNASALGTTDAGTILDGGKLLIENVSITGEALTNNSNASEVQSTGVSAWTGPVVMNRDLAINVFTTSLNISGAISGSGAVEKFGTGVLIYSGTSPNTYTNVTTVHVGQLDIAKSGAGFNNFLGPLIVGDGTGLDIVRVGPGSQLDSFCEVTLNSSGEIEFLTGDNFRSLSGSGNVVLSGGSIGLSSLQPNTISGVISGIGGLSKGGISSLTLTATNTYTGQTTVSSGTLLVNGFQPQSHVLVGAGGNLGGTGTVGNITNVAGGIVAPGASPGILTCSNVTFSGATSDFNVELNGSFPGTGYDQLNTRGSNHLGGSTLNLSVSPAFAPMVGQTFLILVNDGADPINGTFNGLPEGGIVSAGLLKFRISYVGATGNDVLLTFTNPPIEGIAGTVSGGNADSVIDPNECNHLNLILTNASGAPLTGVSAKLTALTPHLVITQPESSYANLAINGTGTNLTPFQIMTLPSFQCGSNITLVLTITSSGGSFNSMFVLPSGAASAPLRFDNNTFTAIPDANFVDSTNIVSGITSSVAKVTVSLYITHPTAADLLLTLIGPDGLSVPLSLMRGGTGDNYGADCADGSRTVFDDAAATPISAGAAPFTNTFRPEGVLATFIGKTGADVNGPWRLRVEDDFPGDAGTLRCWSLFVSQLQCNAGGGLCGTCPGVIADAITGADLVTTNRIFRDGTDSECTTPKTCPGTVGGTDLNYDIHAFTNSGDAACVTVYLDSLCPEAMYAVAYVGGFDRLNLCNYYLADMGVFPSLEFNSFSFTVPAATNFVVVVTEVTDGSGCPYTLVVTGTECPLPVLNIAPVQTDKVRLFWPTHAAGHQLESTPSLGPTSWTTVTNSPVVIGTNYNVTNNITSSNLFYRLHKP